MPFTPLYTVAEIRTLEALATPAGTEPSLMERAGEAAADHACRVAGERTRRVLVLAGPGNNGGDGFEAAVHLKRRFYQVDVCFAGNAEKLPSDARKAYAKWQAAGGSVLRMLPAPAELGRYGLVIDGLFGIGLARALAEPYAQWVADVSSCGVPVLAIDVPSGLNADTGAAMRPTVRAAHTVTFIAAKPGLFTLDGPDFCGAVHVESLGVDAEALQAPHGRLLDASIVPAALAPRPRNFHKGRAGNVIVVGGAPGMVGAALLAARAALQCGAGRVYAALLDAEAPRVDPVQPELMIRSAADMPATDAVIAAGPGLGRETASRRALEAVLGLPASLVLDADALNLISEHETLAAAVRARTAATLMTPHPAEAARLLGKTTAQVQADRVAAALDVAARYSALVALKGNGTVVAAPDGRWWINPTGHPGMASAGMGDALTGIVASLLAQGASPPHALLAGVWVHGAAGDAAAAGNGMLGTTASEVTAHARRVLNAHLG